MKSSVRYSVIAQWLERDAVNESMIYNSNFSYEELTFIVNFNKKKIAWHHPELMKYFEGRFINEYYP